MQTVIWSDCQRQLKRKNARELPAPPYPSKPGMAQPTRTYISRHIQEAKHVSLQVKQIHEKDNKRV
jgi:hypothetical protein